MKAVILAGGYGTRISEESGIRPKPMVEVGGRPILWHIMKYYSTFGIDEFIIACGYKSQVIKEYFANYAIHQSDLTLDLGKHTMEVHKNGAEKWKVTLVETGTDTMTGGRLKRIKDYIGNETFLATYGDGVSNVNIRDLITFHKNQKALVTVTAVQPPGRFGAFTLSDSQTIVSNFREKPKGDGVWINGGYFVLEPEALDYIRDEQMVWEQEPMQEIARDGKLVAFKHDDFWHPMDTLRDKNILEQMWQSNKAPWKVW